MVKIIVAYRILLMKYFAKFPVEKKNMDRRILLIVSHDVTGDGVWIGNQIYWTLKSCNYK
jgi:hypothetical protein